MAEDHDSRLERIEKAQQELREQLIKAQEESRDQFNGLMQIVMQQKEAVGGQDIRTQDATPEENTNPIYHPGFTPPRNPVVCPPPPPTYPYPTSPQFVGQTSNQPSVNNVAPNAPPYTQKQQFPNNQVNNQNNNTCEQKQNRERVRFVPIPVTYAELLPHLLENHLVAKVPLEPLKPPYPRWYDPDARCDYHYGAPGHSTDNCTALKYKVEVLIKSGILNFSNPSEPNVTENPLPNHMGAQVNSVEENEEQMMFPLLYRSFWSDSFEHSSPRPSAQKDVQGK